MKIKLLSASYHIFLADVQAIDSFDVVNSYDICVSFTDKTRSLFFLSICHRIFLNVGAEAYR